MRKLFLALVCASVSGSAMATLYSFDPGVTLTHATSNVNDGYSTGRGVFFRALMDSTVTRAGFFNGFGDQDDFTMSFWTASADGSNLRVSLLDSFSMTPGAVGDAWADGTFSGPVALTAGSFYHLEVTSNASFDKNWFYFWDGPPVDISGVFSIIDGSQGASLNNTVAPALRVDATPVPEPGTMIALTAGLAAVLARRRRRSLA